MSWLRLVVANLTRSRVRALLTACAIALSVGLVCLLLTMPLGLELLLSKAASNTRISIHSKAGLVYSMPRSFIEKVRKLDGVDAAISMTWFGGSFEEEGRVSFPNFAVEPDHVAGVYPEYPIAAEHLSAFQSRRDSALVGSGLMLRYGWRIGDRLTLRSSIWSLDLELQVVGEIADDRVPFLWFDRAYFDEAMLAKWGDEAIGDTLIWARVSDPEAVVPVMKKIEDISRNSDAEATSETEKSFFQNFFGSLQALANLILGITILISFAIILIAANTVSMAIRERAREIAILKAIGFAPGRIFSLLLGETLALSLLSGCSGILLAIAMTRAMKAAAAANEMLGPLAHFSIDQAVVARGLALSIGVGLVAGVIPALGAATRPVAQTLRDVF